MKSKTSPVSILYLFSHPIKSDVERVRDGSSPTERLYGMWELEQRGWTVKYCDARFHGCWAAIVRLFRRFGFNPMDPRTVRELQRADVVVVKDDFSLMASLFCRLFGTRLIYLDSIFVFPRHWWHRWAKAFSIRLCDRVVGYSAAQVTHWSEELQVPRRKFAILPYTLDVSFYERHRKEPRSTGDPYVLAVGRDMGRDYRTLIAATQSAGLKLKLVTLPYLIEGLEIAAPSVEVFQHLSYEELFSLYSGASVVVIPLKAGIDYPSGIRAMLETMVLGCPVVVTRTPALAEYVTDGEDVTFVEAGDVEGMKVALLEIIDFRQVSVERADRARAKAAAKYGMENFVSGFEEIIHQVISEVPDAAQVD
jgi:glycosyltransferase involved in cell wall biosynthesis